jgi:hypothetical protein
MAQVQPHFLTCSRLHETQTVIPTRTDPRGLHPASPLVACLHKVTPPLPAVWITHHHLDEPHLW